MSNGQRRSMQGPTDLVTLDGSGGQPRERDEPPLCFIIDDEKTHRQFLTLVLQEFGFETIHFHDASALRPHLGRTPDLIFLAVPREAVEALEAIHIVGQCCYRGPVQLICSGDTPVLDAVRRVGERYALELPPVLTKPVTREAIVDVLRAHRLLPATTDSVRASLEEALRSGWIEFWYQPKIDLRRKQLAGVETFARVRHPEHGVMSPAAFLGGAGEGGLVALTQEAIINALKIGQSYSRLGISLLLAVNVPVSALKTLPVEAIVCEFRREDRDWPGLIFDITEDQIADDLDLVAEIGKRLKRYDVQIAIDDFGRRSLPLARLKDLPFAELKVDRAFVTDCATDKSHAAICKTVIDLAHNFGALAVAVGVEKPADARTLIALGCDVGQGFLFAQPMAKNRFFTLLRQRAGQRAVVRS
jgi:EAL domain-containing protein (putative c-di-GMP-specific phosphodiesterase class I)